MKKHKLVSMLLLLLLLSAFSGTADTATTSPLDLKKEGLYKEIAYMDSLMFAAFNMQDMEKLKTFFSKNLEFYHDKGGLTDYKQTMENFKNLFERNKETGLRRDLVKGSLEVYPINNYGAVEICTHTFCHMENGKNDCGTFKNMMIWQKLEGQWKVTRVVSYDH